MLSRRASPLTNAYYCLGSSPHSPRSRSWLRPCSLTRRSTPQDSKTGVARRGRGRHAGRDAYSRALLVIGAFALFAVVLTGLWVGRSFDAGVSGPQPEPTAMVRPAGAPIIL